MNLNHALKANEQAEQQLGTQLQTQQELEVLQNAISHLSTNQRLLLQLRFQEGLSLKKIAQLRRLGDTNRAWRQIQTAIKALFDHIKSLFLMLLKILSILKS